MVRVLARLVIEVKLGFVSFHEPCALRYTVGERVAVLARFVIEVKHVLARPVSEV